MACGAPALAKELTHDRLRIALCPRPRVVPANLGHDGLVRLPQQNPPLGSGLGARPKSSEPSKVNVGAPCWLASLAILSRSNK